MDFARKQLLKYGWKEGEGIGKEGNQGIASALKPKYKLGKQGMGYDMSKELVDTWWTRSYQDSLSRINISSASGSSQGQGVTDEDEGVRVTFAQDETGGDEMSKMRRRMMRSNFQEFSKGAVLDNGRMVADSDSETDSGIVTPGGSSTSSTTISDEDLFKACGGRTAHKAARFGHKLSGKLARIAAQEQAELETLSVHSSMAITVSPAKSSRRSKRIHGPHSNHPDVDSSTEKKRKKKSIPNLPTSTGTEGETVEEMDHEPSFHDHEESTQKRKKKSKSSRKHL